MDKEVADKLGVSSHTVHAHIKKIYRKLQAVSRADAVKKAGDLGYKRILETRAHSEGQAEQWLVN